MAERKEKLAQAAQRAERHEQAAHIQSPQQTQQQLTADPDEALAAEEELEANGAAMGEEEIAELLDENLVWITSAGRPVSRASTIEYRARAFTQRGEPTHRVVELVDTANVLVMAVVDTARGRVNRSSLWHYDAQVGSWRLRFRQDTAIPG
ncbi:ribonuclease HI [Rothia aeria]|uniref:Ribonuclease HI n=1 Tax=Rothia aeria TaxID=172042 RepID=A0A2Z5QVK4_9MICC|nr:ribonuclease HI [Rothia aeria]